MKKHTLACLLLLTFTGLLAGCAGMQARQSPTTFPPGLLEDGQYTAKVDNVLFILDNSLSMDRYTERDLAAKNILASINQSLPENVSFINGLRIFGNTSNQTTGTRRVYGMTRYSEAGLAQALEKLPFPGGQSPLPAALAAAGDDLQGLTGTSAIIIVSDGQAKLRMQGAVEAASALKAKMGDRLCIYTISVGGDSAGEARLQRVAQASGCGFGVTAADLASSVDMGNFVKKALLKPQPAITVADSDGDGVIDSEDKCPGTPKGELVDEDGCTLKLTLHINFDFDEAIIKPQFEPDLKKAAAFIQKHQKVPYILIAGYTDSVGDAAYNQQLSERRAQAVKEYLVTNYGIDPQRLIARGRGEANPVADNSTAEGRYQNRRVEIVCCAVVPPE